MADRLLDTMSLTKPQAFSGNDQDWARWCFAFSAYASLVDPSMEERMDLAAPLDEEPVLTDYGREAMGTSRVLYALLVMLCNQGKVANIMMNCARHNGLGAWWRLKQEYEPKFSGRHANMLSGLIAPDWTDCSAEVFREKFLEWEVATQRYEAHIGERMSDSLKIAVVTRHSPVEVRNVIRTHLSALGSDYKKLRDLISDFLISGLNWNITGGTGSSPPLPVAQAMDIGGVTKGPGKGKGEGGKKGKGKRGK